MQGSQEARFGVATDLYPDLYALVTTEKHRQNHLHSRSHLLPSLLGQPSQALGHICHIVIARRRSLNVACESRS